MHSAAIIKQQHQDNLSTAARSVAKRVEKCIKSARYKNENNRIPGNAATNLDIRDRAMEDAAGHPTPRIVNKYYTNQ